MVEQTEPDPGEDILQAVGILGGEIESIEEITRLRATERRRACFRLRLKDGRTVKGRRFGSAEKREAVTAFYPALDGLPFSRLLSVYGAATIDEWVHGEPISADDLSVESVRQLASILGTLNRRKVPREVSTANVCGVDWHSNRLKNLLCELNSGGHIDSNIATKLFDLAIDSRPLGLECGVIHTDFHPQNMILKQPDEIWTIDNEGLRLGVLDYDIARCWRQWPMTQAHRETFCQAYSQFRCLTSFLAHQTFWSTCTLVLTATINARFGRPIQSFLEKLDRVAQNEDNVLWPR